jgi:glycosyltransferase involved in cell wall biosynthesis
MINLITPINNLGYGVAGYNFLKEMMRVDDRVTLYPIGNPEPVDTAGVVANALNNQLHYNPDYPCVKIWHQFDLFQRVGRGKYFGFPIFELDKFKKQEQVSLHHCDEIIVCSNWAKRVMLAETKFKDDEVHVVPLGVDNELFKPLENVSTRSATVFYTCGKWEKRKGHDVIVEAFNKAFSNNDNVELWLMCDNPFLVGQARSIAEGWENLYKNSPMGDKIRLLPRQKTQKDVYNIMRLTDVGLFPARAEGWNLELLEMLSIGTHVLTTNYSAHPDFCNERNAMIIEITNMETAFDGVFFKGNTGRWAEIAEPQMDQLIEHMRNIHERKQNGTLELNREGIETGRKFSWVNAAKELINVCRI